MIFPPNIIIQQPLGVLEKILGYWHKPVCKKSSEQIGKQEFEGENHDNPLKESWDVGMKTGNILWKSVHQNIDWTNILWKNNV